MQTVGVVVPVYDEEKTLKSELNKLFRASIIDEIVVVDDKSNDRSLKIAQNNRPENDTAYTVLKHQKNKGKGGALQTGFKRIQSDIVGVHDADGEYMVQDIVQVVRPIKEQKTNVVYGNRFTGSDQTYSILYYAGNWVLTSIFNSLYWEQVGDLETCYKFMRRDIVKKMQLNRSGFGVEVEITANIIRQGEKIDKVPINYKPRSREEGKKITAWDGIKALQIMVAERFK